LVVVVARINPQKDLGTFLRAMAAVRDRLPQVRAIVVGDGEEAEATKLEALRQSLRLGSTVEFVGRRTTLPTR
jgi:glycosyltransferase involved in cell wall biosynthesis